MHLIKLCLIGVNSIYFFTRGHSREFCFPQKKGVKSWTMTLPHVRNLTRQRSHKDLKVRCDEDKKK